MSDFEIIDRHGNRRRGRPGEILRDGERAVVRMAFMDHQVRDALLEKYGSGATISPGGHRPGFLRDSSNTVLSDAAEAAYREKVQRLDAKRRKVKQPDPDDDDGEEDDGKPKSERQWREAMARKAAQAVKGSDALTLDQARAAADAAWEARVERMRNAWRKR
jgi:hypothetical protein